MSTLALEHNVRCSFPLAYVRMDRGMGLSLSSYEFLPL